MEAISLPAEEVMKIGSISITNSFTSTILSSLIIIFVAFLIRRKAGIVPSRMQMAFEMVLEFFLLQLTTSLDGNEKRARKILPFILTIFVIVALSNQFFLLPLVGAVVTGEEHLHFFRVPTSDYSLTIAFAVLVIFLSHILALCISPMNHINNFFRYRSFLKIRKFSDIPNAFIEFFLGLLEFIGEFAKIISLATRLFGNIFSGEVIIVIVSGLMFYTQFLVPIPFYLLGMLAGLVQAFVFSILSLLFISGTIRNAEHGH